MKNGPDAFALRDLGNPWDPSTSGSPVTLVVGITAGAPEGVHRPHREQEEAPLEWGLSGCSLLPQLGVVARADRRASSGPEETR